ncbi:hypothetical protein NHX12_007088 [Muraenolepis orangiensis]|uniref:Uncharacterized protein n=1 Tax=Muraenolepis orangiensis TaxID=630683 RepID=A0A9Q0IBM0_9TELE|nr:hypothetical protein NHX12_007088 [Muraenolepis orangiensis]
MTGKLNFPKINLTVGWALLCNPYRKALWPESTSDYLSAGDIKAHLHSSKYDEVTTPNSFDITDSFNRDSLDRGGDFCWTP